MGPNKKPTVWMGICKKGLSLFYIVGWDVWRSLRTFFITWVVPILLALLSALEFTGALTHFAPWFKLPTVVQMQIDKIPDGWRLTFAIALFFTAIFTAWHHKRLSTGVRRHRAVLGMSRILLADLIRPDISIEQYCQNVLRALVVTMELSTNRAEQMNASLVVQRDHKQPFTLFAQYPAGTFPESITLDSGRSAAGQALQEEETLVYIPATGLVHGVRIALAADGDGKAVPATTTGILENSFESKQDIEGYPVEKLKSIVCLKVPNGIPHSSRFTERTGINSNASIVLSLGSHKRNKLGELDFNTVQLAVRLLAHAFSQQKD